MRATNKLLIKRIVRRMAAILFAVLFCAGLFFSVRGLCYPKPYRKIVQGCGTEESLVYAVMKAESGFRPKAKSAAGAVGLMQLLPATAEFVCRQHGIPFVEIDLCDGEWNTKLGCLYLNYLLEKFSSPHVAIAAYNAGEGNVLAWLKNSEFSQDGRALRKIPYPETARYVKKVEKFQKKYLFLYH